jgi:hypothetical protein
MLEDTTDGTISHPHDEERNRPTKRPRSGPPGSSYHDHDPAILGITEATATSSEKHKNGPITAVQRVHEKDKNRRLSCKECRRRVDNLSHVAGLSGLLIVTRFRSAG